MPAKLTEAAIEAHALDLLSAQGFTHIHGSDIAPESNTPERHSFAEVILFERLNTAARRINPSLAHDAIADALQQISRFNSPQLLTNNEAFHRLLTEGVNISVQKDGHSRGDYVRLIDFEVPGNNEFLAINQFTIAENNIHKRPDIILFVNGMPLVVIELKNPTGEHTTLNSAFRQLQTYKQTIPSLFTYNSFCIISDGLDAKAGTISAALNRFMAWKTADGKVEASPLIGQLETLIKGMLKKPLLLDLIRHFIVFEQNKKEDTDGIITIDSTKKLAAYHQYHAVNRAVESTLRAANLSGEPQDNGLTVAEAPVSYGLPDVDSQPLGDRKGGVVWHTQGSGKSLSMVFYTGKIVLAMDNPTVVVITDRNDLDDQLFDTFASSKQLLRQEPAQAENRGQLKSLLRVSAGGIVFTTIQKFHPDQGNLYETLSERKNIVVIADEAHRTQYGFKAKITDVEDDEHNIIDMKTAYGFAKYLRDALPNATYLGFTGTPIEKADVNTPAVFGNYVDIYDISTAVRDGATVRIFYASRLAKITLSDEGKTLVKALDNELVQENLAEVQKANVKELDNELQQKQLSEAQKAKAKWTKLEALIGSKERIKQVAADIISHFTQRQEACDGKAMIVTMSRRIATELYRAIIALQPHWHSDDLRKGAIKIVMTAASSDGPEMATHHTSKKQRRALADRMKDDRDELKLVIVCDMWLTGFDVPCLHTIYIDKPMRGHNLMQAIARVNRVYKDKAGGLVVDYLGIASDLKEALSFYSDSGGRGDPAETQEQAVQMMLEKLEVVSHLFHGFSYEGYFAADTSQKLSLILAATNHILGLDDGKKRFINEVTALSQAFSIAIPHERALDAKDEIAFFQAIKSRLIKFDTNGKHGTNEQIETAIRQVIDQALVSEQVIDVFDAAGIKKPDISILSEEFLLEVKHMHYKHVALGVLQKLLDNEIKGRAKKNLVQGKTLMEMLENAIKKYHRNILTAAQVIDALINIAKEIRVMDREPNEMGLSDFEYAFYTAVADNDSATELMGKDKLRELAVVLYKKVKNHVPIDWTIKESIKARLKVIVKRTLSEYGYPPDMQKLAIETVLKQAELLADELVGR